MGESASDGAQGTHLSSFSHNATRPPLATHPQEMIKKTDDQGKLLPEMVRGREREGKEGGRRERKHRQKNGRPCPIARARMPLRFSLTRPAPPARPKNNKKPRS